MLEITSKSQEFFCTDFQTHYGNINKYSKINYVLYMVNY